MSDIISTKPYLIRALHEWCVDNGFTPHLLVQVNAQVRVPMAYVKAGEIVLNLSYGATKDLLIDNEAIVFSARFNGVSQNLYVPMGAVKGIFARENSQGMMFESENTQEDEQLNEFEMPKTDLSDNTESDHINSSENQAAENNKQQKSEHQKPKFTVVK